MKTKWTSADLPEAAVALAGTGARVVLAVRDVEKGRAAVAEIDGHTEARALDLASLASVRAFARDWKGAIAGLINNTDVMAIPRATTADGFEMQIGTNHLGHCALTNLPLPSITDRVVTVSSGLHRGGRLQACGSPVRANAAHPGYASTNLQCRSSSRWINMATAIGNKIFALPRPRERCPPCSPPPRTCRRNTYVGPDRLREQRGNPTLVGRSAAATNVEDAKRLWRLSEELTGVPFPEALPSGT